MCTSFVSNIRASACAAICRRHSRRTRFQPTSPIACSAFSTAASVRWKAQIDNQADLFDPRSAPAISPVSGNPDMLSWLASWVGVTFDRTWPVARRRRFLMEAVKLYPCRGTLPGLRRALLLFLGIDSLTLPRRPAICAANCAPLPPVWKPPPLILEHWKIRRWLYSRRRPARRCGCAVG